MHKVLSLWKEQGGKGTFITDDEEQSIKAVEIAINTLLVKDPNLVLGVIVPTFKYFSYRTYFPNHIIKLDTVASKDVNSKVFHCLFIIGADTITVFMADIIRSIKTKYLFVTGKSFDSIPLSLREVAPRINYISSKHAEYNYIIDMDADTQQRYDSITESLKSLGEIFREYDNVTACIAGNGYMSASAFRDKFAADNGWSKDLNTDIKLFADIDKYYNPDNLYEQATQYNLLIRERDKIIAKAEDKVRTAVAVVLANSSKRIVVLAKGDDTCDDIASSLRRNKVKAESIHANTPGRSLDDDMGNPIRIKTGKDKGSIKVFGTKSVNDYMLQQFAKNKLKVLVTTGTIDKSSRILDTDLLIITSAKAANYYQLKSRISELTFKGDTIIINIAFNIDKDIDAFKKSQRALNLDCKDIFDLKEIVL